MRKSSYSKLNDKYKNLVDFVDKLFTIFDGIKESEPKSKDNDCEIVGILGFAQLREELEPLYKCRIDIDSIPDEIEGCWESASRFNMGFRGINKIMQEFRERADSLRIKK